jgi:hypothetical protein
MFPALAGGQEAGVHERAPTLTRTVHTDDEEGPLVTAWSESGTPGCMRTPCTVDIGGSREKFIRASEASHAMPLAPHGPNERRCDGIPPPERVSAPVWVYCIKLCAVSCRVRWLALAGTCS